MAPVDVFTPSSLLLTELSDPWTTTGTRSPRPPTTTLRLPAAGPGARGLQVEADEPAHVARRPRR